MIDKFGADAVYKEGLKIYVSIDMNMQKAAEQSVIVYYQLITMMLMVLLNHKAHS